MLLTSPEWQADCQKWRKRLLTGKHAHWCFEWDFLPVDETCAEWPCGCWQSETERKMTNNITSEEFFYKRVYALTLALFNNAFCIAGMDGSVWVDDKALADTIAYLERQNQNDTQIALQSFHVRLLSIALETGKLRRVSREEADAIAVEWAARIVAEQNGANDA